MKNYEEMAKCVLEARDAYIRKKQKQKALVKRHTPIVSGFCFAVLIGFGVWKNVNQLPEIPTISETDVIEATTQEKKQETASPATEASSTEKTSMIETDTTTVNTDKALETTVEDSIYTMTASTEETQKPEENPVVSEPAVTEPVVTQPVITEPITNSTEEILTEPPATTNSKTEEPDQETASENPFSWDKQEIYQKFNGCDMGDPPVYFQTALLAVPQVKVDSFLGTAMMSGYDNAASTYHYCTAEAYSIVGVSESVIIAVRFDSFDGYYAYYASYDQSLDPDIVKAILFPEEEGM